MITFVDEKGTEHSALVAYSVTNAVNGELSVKGTIYTNDKVLHGIGRGWRFRLDDEYYRITYAKPNDTGRQIEVEFDAVHQFFYDMSKSMVYTTLNGSKPFETYLQAIFSNSGYTYNLETTVGSIRKENFGNKSRLSLFNDIIKAAGLEFSVRGHVVRILKRIGTDLSTIVRKDFNMNELKIEKDINSFVTYQRGLGAWKDDEDHSKGRYETSYESPLSAIYGRIEADPIVDERYKETGKLLERLKENVDKSYKVSIEIDMEDLSQAGYRISRPNPGDYIMAINETLGFRQKVRIVSFTSEYDAGGHLISRKIVCNDIGTVQRATSEISHLSRTLTDSIEGSERALKTATRALVSADGKNTNYFGDVKPLDVPKGTLRKGDRLFLTVGDKKQLYFWNGAEWELEPTEFDHEKFDMEFNRKSQEIKKTIQETRQKAIEALRNSGASSLLAQEAKRIGLDSIAKLDAFKSQATSAQMTLSSDLDALANEVLSKQEQIKDEVDEQVEALVQTKKELAGVKSAQATYEETTTRRLSELTNLANGKASKSELMQTAEQLASKIASVQIAHKNQGDRVSVVESNFRQRADALDAGVSRLTEGLRTKADISALNVTAENIRQSVKSLETSTQNKLDKKLSMAEFEVRASGIRQEIVNATKDKADKTLVVAEAGKLREEFSKMKVGSRNYAEDYDFSRGLWHYSQGDNSPQDWTISNGEYNVKGTTNTWKQMQIHSKEGSRSSWKSSTALLDLEVGETYTLSFQGICYSGSSSVWLSLRANRTVSGNPEIIPGTFNLTSSWQTYQVTIPALTKPDNFDFWRIILGYDGIGHVAFRKVELTRSSTRIDAGPAPEDGKTDLVVAKSEFEKTAEGLSSKLATVETYVSQDGQRQEALRKYSRDESARQATTVRELVSRDFVGKASYQEDVRGINQRIEEAKKNASNELTTRLANYRQTVDGKFTDISSQVTTYKQVTDEKFGDLSNQIVNNKNSTDGQIENVRNQLAKKVEVTDFQRVQETSKLYERILGSTDNVIANNVARMAMTSQLFQVEVAKSLGSDNNLIVRSKSMDRHTLVNEGDTKRVFVNNGIFTIRCTGNSGYTFAGFTLPIYIDRMARGETYTLNFKYRIMGRLDHNFTVVAKNHQSNEGIFSSNIATSSTAVSSNWQVFNETYTISRDFEFGDNKLYPIYFYLAKNGWVEIKEIMLVRASQTNGYKASQFDDMSEAVRSVQSQFDGSWAVQNLTSAGSIVSQINATNNQILIEAEKIRLKGKTLLDELTAIQGYFKRLFVGDASVGTLNSDIIRSNSITADKLVMDMAMARRFVSSDIFTDTLAAKEAFINKLRSVVVTATLLEGYRGLIGGFQIGTHEKDSSVYWITGQNQFSVGMSNGSGHWSQTALWVNWGNDWGYPGDYAWYVKNNGKMYCYNTAEFWNTPVIHGNLRVTGHIYYNNENSGKTGHWIHSSKYSNFEPSDNYLYMYYSGSGYDWIPMNKEISDRRYKTNIEASTVSGLDVVESLKTYSYRKEYDGKIEDISCGIMAQDVQKYAPEAFFENPDGAYSYNTFALVPYLIKAIQELNHKIEKLEKTA